jgi:hypothetical protein
MEKILLSLQRIAVSLEKIGRDIRHEEQVYKAELEDRLSKGLTGDDAIQHYNDWMEAAGQSHLKITDYGHLLQKL